MVDEIGNRMKENYENRSKTYLVRRMPVIIRIDGKAFHTFTRGFHKPFDQIISDCMLKTTQGLCCQIQGCKFGYTQSDEISLLLTDYDKLETSAWFDYSVQKICSVAASMATALFNNSLSGVAYADDPSNHFAIMPKYLREYNAAKREQYFDMIKGKVIVGGAIFDARCFNIPKEEVANYFIWRQADASRNAIQMVGRSHCTKSELNGKSCSQVLEMLAEKGVNYEDYPLHSRIGLCCHKEEGSWVTNYDTEKFVDDRSVIEKYVYLNKE